MNATKVKLVLFWSCIVAIPFLTAVCCVCPDRWYRMVWVALLVACFGPAAIMRTMIHSSK